MDTISITTLATWQRDLTALKADRRKLLESVTETDAYKSLTANIESLEYDIAQMETVLEADALAEYHQTGNKKPAAGFGIRMMTRLRYDAVEALDWARKNLQSALKLDAKFFESHAKAVAKTTPIPGVEIVQEATVTIGDLSGYLDTADAVLADQEIPF